MLYTTNLNLKKPESTDTVNVEDFNGNADILDAALQGKVDKAAGKGLSQEDYTTAEKTKLAGIAAGANQYVHPNHTGDVTSNGDGVTAIAPGVIVNADINASAAIDATKIADGTVDNAEFGYLNGVTGPIQSQLDAKSAVSDYIRQPGYAAATGSANVYAVTLSPALAAYAAGVCVAVKINVANTGASTLNVNGLGAKAILDSKGNAMTAGKLKADSIYTLRYNGTAFIVQGDGPDEASDILGKIKTVDGAGSGLDADLLGGIDSTGFMRSTAIDGNTDLNTVTQSGVYRLGSAHTNAPLGVHYGQLLVLHGALDTITQIVTDYSGNCMYWRSGNPAVVGGVGTWSAWHRVLDDSLLRINAGTLEMNDGTGWKPVGDSTLSNYFGHFGNFPFFGNAADVIISANTTWSDPEGYKRVKKLTINAGVTLKINKFPFFIFADEIVFGSTTSSIDASGWDGAQSNTVFNGYGGAKGAIAIGEDSVIKAVGGCGGGLIFIICRRVSGAAGLIKANGGNGWSLSGAVYYNANVNGEGALFKGTLSSAQRGVLLAGFTPTSTISNGFVPPSFMARSTGNLLVNNGEASVTMANNGSAYGGGGIASGGGSGSAANQPGQQASLRATPEDLLKLAQLGLTGGGGGSGANYGGQAQWIGAGGGGGGAVVVFTRDLAVTPTLQANGGNGGAGVGSSVGGAGITHLVVV